MLCIFGGTDKSVPYNPIVIWRSAKKQFVELFSDQIFDTLASGGAVYDL